MKVVFLSAVGSLGGAEQLLLSAIDSLRSCDPTLELELELELVALGEGPLLEAASALGARVRAIRCPSSSPRSETAACGDEVSAGAWASGCAGSERRRRCSSSCAASRPSSAPCGRKSSTRTG